jgi:hypothetical protein
VLPDPLDIEPHDPELLAEIQLLASLLVLAHATDSTRLSGGAIDAALGLAYGDDRGVPEDPPVLMLL